MSNEDIWIPRKHSTVTRLFDNKALVAKQSKALLIYYYEIKKT